MPKAKKPTIKKEKKAGKPKEAKKAVSKKEPKAEALQKTGRHFERGENQSSARRAGSYFEAVGRRKTSIARVRLFAQGEKSFLVNEKPCEKYFPTKELQQIINSPLELMNCLDKFKWVVKVKGGGVHSQAEALRHGISRALILFNETFRKRLKKAGYLTRDSRMRERKKFGLKRARRAPQWQKR